MRDMGRRPGRRGAAAAAAGLVAVWLASVGAACAASVSAPTSGPAAASPKGATPSDAVPGRTYLNQSTVAAHPAVDDGGANAILAAAEREMEAGRFAQAETGFRSALTILNARAATAPSQALDDQIQAVTSMLAFMVVNQGRTAEAEQLARPVEAGGLPSSHAARQRASLVLAIVAGMGGRYSEAAERLKGLVDMAVAADDRETAGQLSVMLATVYRTLGRNQDAVDALAVATLPAGPMSDLARLRQASDRGDADAAIAAADALLALPQGPGFPDSMRAYALAERAKMLNRRAGSWTGDGPAPDRVEAERSVRTALDAGLSSEAPLMNVILQESLAMTLLTDAGETPQSPRTREGVALMKTVADRREQLLGIDNPAAVGSRIDYAVWLSVTDHHDEALTIMDAMAARADRAPGLMTRERRGMLDVSRATMMMEALRLGDAYLTMRAAGQSLEAFALAPERRDAARQSLASRAFVFRTQVMLAFLADRAMRRAEASDGAPAGTSAGKR